MKIKITMKDPDGVYDSVRAAAIDSANNVPGLSDDERDALTESRHAEIEQKLKPWLIYGEYITIEFDLDNQTATVVKRQQ